MHGVTYAPWAKDQDPIEAKASGVWSFLRTAFTDAPPPVVKPRKEQIERDFAMLSGKVNYVRPTVPWTAATSCRRSPRATA